MKQRWTLFLLAAALLWATPSWASEIFGKISYKGAPLKNADLSVDEKAGKTNELGFYSVNVDPGSYVLKIKLPDGTSRDEKIDVFPQPTEKNWKLE